jgi:translation initiation factor 1
VANDDDLSSIAGLPDELGIDDDLARTEQQLSIRVESRRYDKPVTIVEGFDDSANISDLASTLKSRVAAGGTVTDGQIELQGDHQNRLPDILRDEGFQVE